jgi:hypothetical protein
MTRVELIYDADCPAADGARRNLREALEGVNPPPRWTEWERSSPAAPQWTRAFGSPTVLVNGRDIAGSEAVGAASCRIYQPQPGSLAAVPPVGMIAAALREASAAEPVPRDAAPPRKWLGIVAIPAVLASLLPALGCPLCWPAYAALLSSLGLGFLASPRYLLPVTLALLAIALAGLGAHARRRGYAPLMLGVVSAGVIVLGKFEITSAAATDAGVILLLFASALSLRRNRHERSASCIDCPTRKREAGFSHRPTFLSRG